MSGSTETKGSTPGGSTSSGSTLPWIQLAPIAIVSTAAEFRAAKLAFAQAVDLRLQPTSPGSPGEARFAATMQILNSMTYHDGRRMAIYREGGVVIGLMTFAMRKSMPAVQVDQLAGNPYYRNVGGPLLEFALNLDPARPKLVLVPIDKGPEAFYASLGFVPVGEKGNPTWVLDPATKPDEWVLVGGKWRRSKGGESAAYQGVFEPPVP